MSTFGINCALAGTQQFAECLGVDVGVDLHALSFEFSERRELVGVHAVTLRFGTHFRRSDEPGAVSWRQAILIIERIVSSARLKVADSAATSITHHFLGKIFIG